MVLRRRLCIVEGVPCEVINGMTVPLRGRNSRVSATPDVEKLLENASKLAEREEKLEEKVASKAIDSETDKILSSLSALSLKYGKKGL